MFLITFAAFTICKWYSTKASNTKYWRALACQKKKKWHEQGLNDEVCATFETDTRT